MTYSQYKAGIWQRDCIGNILFDENTYQTAESLSDEQRIKFEVYLVAETLPVMTATQKLGAVTRKLVGRAEERTYAVVNKTAAELAAENTFRITGIKYAARQYILARYPDWKQANMTAAMLELVNKKLTIALSADELAMQTALMGAWAWVKSVRTASDVAEAQGIAAADIVWPV